jgi:hypothetical protein
MFANAPAIEATWQSWHNEPLVYRGVAQLGSAPALGAGGRRFESSRPDLHLLPTGTKSFQFPFQTYRQHRRPFAPKRIRQPIHSGIKTGCPTIDEKLVGHACVHRQNEPIVRTTDGRLLFSSRGVRGEYSPLLRSICLSGLLFRRFGANVVGMSYIRRLGVPRSPWRTPGYSHTFAQVRRPTEQRLRHEHQPDSHPFPEEAEIVVTG